MEFTQQPEFLNCAVGMDTALNPRQILDAILRIEGNMGRNRSTQPPKGPRTIDIDLLLAGDVVIRSPELVLPHPAMQDRRFVLEPLAEIAPDAIHPLLHRTIRELRDRLPLGETVRKLPRVTPTDSPREGA